MMLTSANRTCAALLAVMVMAPAMSSAQTATEISKTIIQGGVLDSAVKRGTRAGVRNAVPAGEDLDGEAGLYVMTLNEIFHVGVGGGVGYADNAERVNNSQGGSFYSDVNVLAGVATRLAGKADVALSMNINGREFTKDYGPSSRAVGLTASVGTGIGDSPFYAGANLFSGQSYGQSFKEGMRFDGASINFSGTFMLGQKAYIRPGIGYTRQRAEVKENNSHTINLSADFVRVFTPRLTAVFRVGAHERRFDDFYEDVTFVERRDKAYTGSASLIWKTAERLTLTVGLNYERVASSFFLAKFTDQDLSFALNVQHAF